MGRRSWSALCIINLRFCISRNVMVGGSGKHGRDQGRTHFLIEATFCKYHILLKAKELREAGLSNERSWEKEMISGLFSACVVPPNLSGCPRSLALSKGLGREELHSI